MLLLKIPPSCEHMEKFLFIFLLVCRCQHNPGICHSGKSLAFRQGTGEEEEKKCKPLSRQWSVGVKSFLTWICSLLLWEAQLACVLPGLVLLPVPSLVHSAPVILSKRSTFSADSKTHVSSLPSILSRVVCAFTD